MAAPPSPARSLSRDGVFGSPQRIRRLSLDSRENSRISLVARSPSRPMLLEAVAEGGHMGSAHMNMNMNMNMNMGMTMGGAGANAGNGAAGSAIPPSPRRGSVLDISQQSPFPLVY